MNNKEEIRKQLKGIVWDYNIDPYDFYLLSLGKHQAIGFFDQQKALLRLLERLSWYELINLYGIEFIKNHLSHSLINEIRDQELKKKYEFLRKVLQGEPVSFTGWNTETRKKIKSSVLSHRWDRS